MASSVKTENKVFFTCPQCGNTKVLKAEEVAGVKRVRCTRCWAYMIRE